MAKLLVPKLANVFVKMSAEALMAESESDRKDRLARRRTTLRLLTEMLVSGVYTDASVLIGAMHSLIEQESKAIFSDARAMLFTIISGFVKYAGDVMVLAPTLLRSHSPDRVHLLPLLFLSKYRVPPLP